MRIPKMVIESLIWSPLSGGQFVNLDQQAERYMPLTRNVSWGTGEVGKDFLIGMFIVELVIKKNTEIMKGQLMGNQI